MGSESRTPSLTLDPLLSEVLLALEASGVSEREFGLTVANDTALVGKMRRGRWIKKRALRDAIKVELLLMKKTGK